MVTPAFGFSFGDIVAAINLITKAAKALRKIDGASSRYQQTALELDALLSVIQRVQAFGSSGGDPALVKQIQLYSHICHGPLDRFISKIKDFDLSVDTLLNQSRPLKTNLNKARESVQWAVCIEKEVSALKAAILPQLTAIDLLLQLANVERLSAIKGQNGALTANLNQLFGQTNQIKTHLIGEVATRSDVTALIPLFDNLLLDQSSQRQASVDLTDTMDNLTDDLRTKLSHQEALLHSILGHVSGSNTADIAIQTQQVPPSLPSSAVPDSATHLTSASDPPDKPVVVSPLAQAIHNVRARVWEVVLMLPYLIHAFRYFLRTATTLCRGVTLLLSDNIHLEDALGRTMSLQYEHFRFWPVMEARLRCAFDGVPGALKVQRNHYRIVLANASTEVILNAQNWTQSVFPGSKLQMSMLFGHSDDSSGRCPRCHKQCKPLKDNHWAYCSTCELRYRLPKLRRPNLPWTLSKSDRLLRYNELIHRLSGSSLGSKDVEVTEEDEQEVDEALEENEEEIQFFKCVYLVKRRNSTSMQLPSRFRPRREINCPQPCNHPPFTSESEFYKHYIGEHERPRRYICTHGNCSFETYRPEQFRRHHHRSHQKCKRTVSCVCVEDRSTRGDHGLRECFHRNCLERFKKVEELLACWVNHCR